MKSKWLLILLAACLLLGAGWSCQREQCEAGVKDGKVEISDDLAAYFEFKEGSEWIYTAVNDTNEYFARVYNHQNSVGIGEETTVRCVLGKSILSFIESNMNSIPYSDSLTKMALLMEKDAQEDSVKVLINCFQELFRFSYNDNISLLTGLEGTDHKLLNKHEVNNATYGSVIKIWNANSIDTLYFASGIGLIQIVKNGKNYQLNNYKLL